MLVISTIALLLLVNDVQSQPVTPEYLLQTVRLPEDLNFMPTLANGHLGYTVFGNAIYMNGIYNGRMGQSRRARLPNWLNLTAIIVGPENPAEHDATATTPTTTTTTATAPTPTPTPTPVPILYEMNLQHGYFRWRDAPSSSALPLSSSVRMEQRTYAHRFYNRALIYELSVERSTAKESLFIKITQRAGNLSEAFDFIQPPKKVMMINDDESVGPADVRNDRNVNYKVLQGTTRLVEHEKFQTVPRTVYVVFSDDIGDEKLLEMAPGQKQLHYRFVITVDENQSDAVMEMHSVLALDTEQLLVKHINEWQHFWENFSIDVKGNLELAQTINAGIFYLANSLPSVKSHQPNRAYFGLSPTGLGRGELDDDYEGHNFWDTEIWMLPVVTQFSTEWARILLQYRLQHLPGALFNANLTGYKGARFPWESAFTGTEVTNPCCPEVAAQEIHISADLVFALQQYYITTNDRHWLCQSAWPLVQEIATFLESRVSFDDITNTYHVIDVMGPDEDHWNVTDNVYTNVIFKIALEFADYTQGICDSQKIFFNQNWLQIAKNLSILYDKDLDYHPQHEGYQRGEEIKQADVILLGYPLQFPMNVSTRNNDLNNYESVTRTSGPAMTWSMFAINFLDVDDTPKADQYFVRGYKDYARHAFKVWSETKVGYKGSANFLTGIGGFLQAVINGYARIRLHREGEIPVMEMGRPRLLPGSTEVTIKGIKFANATFMLEMKTTGMATLTCLELGTNDIELSKGEEKFRIFKGYSVNFEAEKVQLRAI